MGGNNSYNSDDDEKELTEKKIEQRHLRDFNVYPSQNMLLGVNPIMLIDEKERELENEEKI